MADVTDKALEKFSGAVEALTEKLLELGPETYRLWEQVVSHTVVKIWMKLGLLGLGWVVWSSLLVWAIKSKFWETKENPSSEGLTDFLIPCYVISGAVLVLFSFCAPGWVAAVMYPEGMIVKEFLKLDF